MQTKNSRIDSKVLIVPRMSLGRQQGKEKIYAAVIKKLLLKYENLQIFLMGQSSITKYADDDYIEINGIMSNLEDDLLHRVILINIKNKSLLEILSIVSDFDCIIAERAFTMIMGLSLRVPTITIDPYGGKNIGLAKLFNFAKFALLLQEFVPYKVTILCDEVIRKNKFYKASLDEYAKKLFDESITNTRNCFLEVQHWCDKNKHGF